MNIKYAHNNLLILTKVRICLNSSRSENEVSNEYFAMYATHVL